MRILKRIVFNLKYWIYKKLELYKYEYALKNKLLMEKSDLFLSGTIISSRKLSKGSTKFSDQSDTTLVCSHVAIPKLEASFCYNHAHAIVVQLDQAIG